MLCFFVFFKIYLTSIFKKNKTECVLIFNIKNGNMYVYTAKDKVRTIKKS